MKRWLPLTAIVLLAALALAYSEYSKADANVGPGGFLNWLAQTQREATRAPMKLTRLSDAEEYRIGESLATQYSMMAQGDPSQSQHNAQVEQYINEVGARVVGGSTQGSGIVGLRTRRKLTYKFYYIPDKGFINAFALPGGHIFVGEGLLSLMDSEDELADILGHEVEHVDRYHCAERFQIEARLRHLPLSGLINLPFEVFLAGYSKEQELESDREGTMLAVNAGYSAQGAIRMFEKFAKLEKEAASPSPARNPEHEISKVAWETLRGYFRSHPEPRERKRQIEDLINSKKLVARAERPLALPK